MHTCNQMELDGPISVSDTQASFRFKEQVSFRICLFFMYTGLFSHIHVFVIVFFWRQRHRTIFELPSAGFLQAGLFLHECRSLLTWNTAVSDTDADSLYKEQISYHASTSLLSVSFYMSDTEAFRLQNTGLLDMRQRLGILRMVMQRTSKRSVRQWVGLFYMSLFVYTVLFWHEAWHMVVCTPSRSICK